MSTKPNLEECTNHTALATSNLSLQELKSTIMASCNWCWCSLIHGLQIEEYVHVTAECMCFLKPVTVRCSVLL